MQTAVMSAATSLGVSAEALDVFLQLVSLTSKLSPGEQFQKTDCFHYETCMESLIEEYNRKM
jgi:hypothetical protein